jgi:hypothetical protein
MEIAKGIKNTDYKMLDLNDVSSNDWLTAFDYLDKRLTERFIEPSEILIESEKHKSSIDKKYGFTILAIDCMLAETIQSFYEGIINSTGQSKQIFKRFLLERKKFSPYFTKEKDAEDFYTNFRCGILHQTQTTCNTLIWSVGQLIQEVGEKVIVNRNLFHQSIKEELKTYISTLKGRAEKRLLDNFKKKMDFIADS